MTRSCAGSDTPIESYLELLDKQRNRNGALAASLACSSVADDYERYLRGCNSHLVADPEEGLFAAYMDLNSLYAYSGKKIYSSSLFFAIRLLPPREYFFVTVACTTTMGCCCCCV